MIKRVADSFFLWFCNPDYYPDIKGDLEEIYQRGQEKSKRKAEWAYAFEVLKLFRPSLIKSLSQNSFMEIGMFKNYLKIGTRNLVKHKMFMTINIAGLTIGLIGFLLIGEYIRFEESYDAFHDDANQLYRLSVVEEIDGQVEVKDAMASHPVVEVLFNDVPEVVDATNSYKLRDIIIRKDDSVVREEGIVTGDSSFLNLFTYEILQGSRETMLSEPNTIVLTKSKAEFYFGSQNAVGQTLEILGSYANIFTVTGVIEDVPQNTHYKFDMIISDPTMARRDDYTSWNWNNNYVYLKIDESTDLAVLRNKLRVIAKTNYGEESSSIFEILPVKDIHLKSDYTYEPEAPGSAKTVGLMFLISIFIIVIAWVNYINLSTARAVDRAKEVGLRKVIGAYRSQLVTQFLCEAFIVNMLAAVLALMLAEWMLPYFNQLVGTEILEHVWNYQPFLVKLTVFFLIGTLVSGFYPALVLSSYKPIASLKGLYRNSRGGIFLRKGLVVIQFVISIALIAGTLIVNRQVNYMLDKDLGIDTDYVVGFRMPSVAGEDQEERISRARAFRDQLRSHSAIQSVSAASNLLGGGSSDISATTTASRIAGRTDWLRGTTYLSFLEDGFIETMGMTVLHGRSFELMTRASDSSAVIVNEAYLKRFNLSSSDDIIGEVVEFGSDDDKDRFNVIGVIKDFNRTSLKSAVEPTVYVPITYRSETVVKLDPENFRAGLDYLQGTWKEYFTDAPLDYTFLDDRFAALYSQDQRFRRVFGVFSILAILIATMGLFGLASFLSIQRTKEVGVRKVLGASTTGIIGLFYSDFISLIALATLIGAPAVYFGMMTWLENYAYRIDFPWELVGLSLLVVIVLALITVGYQTYKVAILNPAKTLKHE